MKEEEFSDYRLVVLPGSCLKTDELRPYYNNAYNFWKRIWKRVMNRLEGPGSFLAEDFYRQSYVSMIMHKESICCLTTSRVFDTRDMITQDLKYFEIFNRDQYEVISSSNCHKLMSIEHNSINPRYSLRRTGFGFVEALLSINLQMAKELELEGCLGVTRNITGVQDTGYKIGFKKIATGLVRHNCPVEIQFADLSQLPKHENTVIQKFIKYLWSNRIDDRFIENKALNTTQIAA